MKVYRIALFLGAMLLPFVPVNAAAATGDVAQASVEAESMAYANSGTTTINDANASEGKAAALSTNGTISGQFKLLSHSTSVQIIARGDQCKGAPMMTVKVDGAQIGSASVSNTSWSTYSVNKTIAAGTHSFELAYPNDYKKGGCNRNLYIDKTTFTGPAGKLMPPSGAWFGAFHSNRTTSTNEVEYANFETLVGRTFDINHHYADWNTTYWPGSYESWDVAGGRIPMDSWGGKYLANLDAVNNGSQDAVITAKAQKIKNFGHTMYLRLWWEMNGNWNYTYQGVYNNDAGTTNGPSKYVQAWQRVHNIFQREGATNAAFVWSPNCSNSPRDAWNHWTNYYPGDAYVDWVACDGYNWGTSQSWSSWQQWSQVFGGTTSVYNNYPNKPFMAAETSSCEQGGDKGSWITQMQNSIKTNFPNVKAIVWFDSDNTATENCDWRVNSSQNALDAFKAFAADPYFQP